MATALSSLRMALKRDVGNCLCPQVSRGIASTGVGRKLITTKDAPEKNSKAVNDRVVPKNIQEFQESQKAKFSPLRSRETNSARISYKVQQPASAFSSGFMSDQKSHESRSERLSHPADAHVGVYDCNNAVSLSSVVSSNVPSPFKLHGDKSTTQYNMQGGLACQGDKYIAGDLQDHQHHIRNPKGSKAE